MTDDPHRFEPPNVAEVPDDFVWGEEQDALVSLSERVQATLGGRFSDSTLGFITDWVGNRVIVEWVGDVPHTARALVELERLEGQSVEFPSADPRRREGARSRAVRRAMTELTDAGFIVSQGWESDEQDLVEVEVRTTTHARRAQADTVAQAVRRKTGFQVRLHWSDDAAPALGAVGSPSNEPDGHPI